MNSNIDYSEIFIVDLEQEPWYTMADGQEVYNTLNALAMTFEPFKELNEATYGDSIRQYDFNGDTFFKAEQVWAEREGLA